MPRPPSNGTTRLILRSYRIMRRLTERGRWREARAVSFLAKMVTGVELQPGARIGDGLVIMHGQSLVIGQDVVIGRDCLLHHEVSIGYRDHGCPVIGDRVTIYPGAKVVGPISIGDDVVIGANAVVLEDVPAGKLVVAPRARVIG